VNARGAPKGLFSFSLTEGVNYRLQSVLGAQSAACEKSDCPHDTISKKALTSNLKKSSFGRFWLFGGAILKLVLKPAKEPEAQNPQKSAILRILGVGYASLVLERPRTTMVDC